VSALPILAKPPNPKYNSDTPKLGGNTVRKQTIWIILIVTALVSSCATSQAPFTERYDKFLDATFVTSRQLSLKDGHLGVGALRLSALAEKSDPSSIVLMFWSRYFKPQPGSGRSGYQYKKNRDLILLIDGERLVLDKPSHDHSVVGERLFEYMRVTIPSDLLLVLAFAQKVEGRLGSTEFELTKSQQAVLAKYAEHLGLISPDAEAAGNEVEREE
jgi:hypothetical protein